MYQTLCGLWLNVNDYILLEVAQYKDPPKLLTTESMSLIFLKHFHGFRNCPFLNHSTIIQHSAIYLIDLANYNLPLYLF